MTAALRVGSGGLHQWSEILRDENENQSTYTLIDEKLGLGLYNLGI